MAESAERLYSALVQRRPEAERSLPDEMADVVAPNGLRLVLANALQSCRRPSSPRS